MISYDLRAKGFAVKPEWQYNISDIKMSNADLYFHDDVKHENYDNMTKILIQDIKFGKYDYLMKHFNVFQFELYDEIKKAFEDRIKVINGSNS
jgi:hypothetical protein